LILPFYLAFTVALQGTFGCTGADSIIQRYETSRQRLQQLEQLQGNLETR
jgi:hypothetical protein